MIRLKHNSKASVNTTNDYENAVLINRINVKLSLLLLQNNNSNAALYRIYASLEHNENELTNSQNDVWYKLEENTLNPNEKIAYTLTEPWNWLLIQVKNKFENQPTTLVIYHGVSL